MALQEPPQGQGQQELQYGGASALRLEAAPWASHRARNEDVGKVGDEGEPGHRGCL